MKLTIDRDGMVAMLKGEFGRAAVSAATANIAASVRAPVPVRTESHEARYTAAGAVVLDHAAGLALEAKHGYLTTAALQAGYDLGRVRRL